MEIWKLLYVCSCTLRERALSHCSRLFWANKNEVEGMGKCKAALSLCAGHWGRIRAGCSSLQLGEQLFRLKQPLLLWICFLCDTESWVCCSLMWCAVPNRDFACVYCSTGELSGRNGAAELQTHQSTRHNFHCSLLEMQKQETFSVLLKI